MADYQTTTTAKSALLPVTLQEAKNQLRVVGQELDWNIQSTLNAAVDYCERVTGRSLRVSHTVVQSYSAWPYNPIRFDRQPVTSITHVKYYDADNVLQTVTSTNYRLIASSDAAATLEFLSDYSQPALYDRSDAVQVTYAAGYATVDAIPPAAKTAILLALEKFWGNLDERQTGPLDRALSSLLASCEWGAYR